MLLVLRCRDNGTAARAPRRVHTERRAVRGSYRDEAVELAPPPASDRAVAHWHVDLGPPGPGHHSRIRVAGPQWACWYSPQKVLSLYNRMEPSRSKQLYRRIASAVANLHPTMAAIKRANKELADLLKVMNATDSPRPERWLVQNR